MHKFKFFFLSTYNCTNLENAPEFKGDNVGLRSFGVPTMQDKREIQLFLLFA